MVDKTHSAAIMALALAKDGCTKLTVLKSGSPYTPSKSLSSANTNQGEFTPTRGRPQRKSKRWRIRQSVAEIIAGREAGNSTAFTSQTPTTNLRRSNSDQRLNEDKLSVREKIKQRPRRKTTAGLDNESIEAINQVNALKPAKSVPNFSFIGDGDADGTSSQPEVDQGEINTIPGEDEVKQGRGSLPSEAEGRL